MRRATGTECWATQYLDIGETRRNQGVQEGATCEVGRKGGGESCPGRYKKRLFLKGEGGTAEADVPDLGGG